MTPRILVTEDDPDCAGLLQTVLAAAGYSVRCCQDGYQAIAWGASLAPALIILDYRLPGCDGLQVLGRLRQQQNLRDVPVILYSDAPEARAAIGHAPAAFLVEKSLGLRPLLALMAKLLPRMTP